MQAKEIMSKKIVSVGRNSTIKEIALNLAQHRISGLPVLTEDGDLVGIVTEGDLLRRKITPRIPDYINILGAVIYFHGVDRYNEDFKKLLAQKAEDIMTADVVTAEEDTDVSDVASMMLDHDIKQIPVVKGSKMIGMITRADIVRLLAMDK